MTPIQIARQAYASTLGPDHLWHNRILAGLCDTAPNMRPFIEQAEREALKHKVEVMDE